MQLISQIIQFPNSVGHPVKDDLDVDDWPHDGPDGNPKTQKCEQLAEKHDELTKKIYPLCVYIECVFSVYSNTLNISPQITLKLLCKE